MPAPQTALLTVIVVSYNTRDLTLAALRTLFETTDRTAMHVVLYDNDSHDGSAQAVREAFPQVEVIESKDNLGFAKANNVVAETATTEWLLLLNPDTECHRTDGVGAVDALMDFAQETRDAGHPALPAGKSAGIWGGRTVFPDGSLNIASCWNKITLWSVICRNTGLDRIFRTSETFNTEAMGDWKRDSTRAVDIVVGCFLMIRTELWKELGGFDLKYFMYGEESDLCLRAAAKGYQPLVTPSAQIMHIVGAAAGQRSDKKISVLRARATLIRDHWPAWQVPMGLGLMWLGAGLRRYLGGSPALIEIWQARKTWMKGY